MSDDSMQRDKAAALPDEKPSFGVLRSALADTKARPPQQDWITKRYHVEVVTPILGGGVRAGEPDRELPVRATSIRGQLRFWWRLLASQGAIEGCRCIRSDGSIDMKKLSGLERERFGGISDAATGTSGQLTLRVIALSPSVPTEKQYETVIVKPDGNQIQVEPFFRGVGKFRGVGEYALFMAKVAQDQKHKVKRASEPGKKPIMDEAFKPGEKAKRLIVPPFSFEINFQADPGMWGELETVLRWWASFGSIGSRSRRGLGTVRVSEIGEKNTKVLLRRVNEEEATAANCDLVDGRELHTDAMDAWRQAIKTLADFRQGRELGRNKGDAQPGRSRWPEPTSVRAEAKAHREKANGTMFDYPSDFPRLFPRALFGLPIVFHFQNIPRDDPRRGVSKDLSFDPKDVVLGVRVPKKDGEKDTVGRFASPLILKARAKGDKFVACALVLPHDEIMSKELVLDHKSLWMQDEGPMESPLPISNWWPSGPTAHDYVENLPVPGVTGIGILPLKNQGGGLTDPLAAFLHYFKSVDGNG